MVGVPGSAAVLGTVSKHAIAGVVAIVIGVLVVGFGLVRAAIRTAMLFIGVIVVVIGILLATRTI
jgi:hypothetical protein